VLNESASVFIVLLAWLWLNEKLTRRQGLGMVLTAFGIGLMLAAKW
jgi:drug/metabolite transporter (DMT)-like permease